MRGIGKGVRSFKEGINGIEKDIKDGTDVDRQDGVENKD